MLPYSDMKASPSGKYVPVHPRSLFEIIVVNDKLHVYNNYKNDR